MATNPINYIVDVGIGAVDLNKLWLLGVSGSVTATGFFIDHKHHRTGDSFSTTINQANGTNDPKQLSTSIPDDAVGAYVVLSGDVYFDVVSGTAFSTDFESNYANYPKVIMDPEYNIFGRGA